MYNSRKIMFHASYFLNDAAQETVPALSSLADVAKPVIELVDSLYGPLITIVSSVAVIYCIFLGVKLAAAGEPQDREKAKSSLKNAIIGYLLIFVLILILRAATPVLTDWVSASV